jgi:primary-amine oxidase
MTKDQVAAMALPATYPPFVQSVRWRGQNVSDVGCGVLSRGWFGAGGHPAYGGGKVAKVQCSVTAGSANFYARPLEGVTLVVRAGYRTSSARYGSSYKRARRLARLDRLAS